MPQIGLCTDLTCDKEIKQLYECHCCSRFICLNHLIEHVEITKRNKERFDSLSNELIIITDTLKLIIEKKLLDIEYEKNLIEQAKQILDVKICSIDEIQNIFERINQAITSNRSEEAIVKVESSLSNIKNCSCICKCDNENDQSLLKNTYSESKSPICLDLTDDTDETEKLETTKSTEYSMYADHEFIDNILLDETIDSLKDGDEEQNKEKSTGITTFFGLCPLTFNGAYGLSEAKHSIRFCSIKKVRRIGLYSHFISKHKLKSIYARRLVQAIVNEQDPMTTNLFDEKEDVINHFYKIPCPFNQGMVNLFGYNKKNISKVPCRFQSVIRHGLKWHLKQYHKLPDDLARKIANDFKEIRMKNDVISS